MPVIGKILSLPGQKMLQQQSVLLRRLAGEIMKTTAVNKYKGEYDIWAGRGSQWGNEYTHLPLHRTKAKYQVATRQESLRNYERDARAREGLVEWLRPLVGKRIGCVCHPLPCHVHILIKLIRELNLESQ
jgi:hypothetical protein